MGLIKCPDCKNKISSSAPTCPHCGRPMKGNNSKSNSPMNRNVGCSTYVFLAIIVMVFIGWTMGKSNDDTNQTVKMWTLHESYTKDHFAPFGARPSSFQKNHQFP